MIESKKQKPSYKNIQAIIANAQKSGLAPAPASKTPFTKRAELGPPASKDREEPKGSISVKPIDRRKVTSSQSGSAKSFLASKTTLTQPAVANSTSNVLERDSHAKSDAENLTIASDLASFKTDSRLRSNVMSNGENCPRRIVDNTKDASMGHWKTDNEALDEEEEDDASFDGELGQLREDWNLKSALTRQLMEKKRQKFRRMNSVCQKREKMQGMHSYEIFQLKAK